MDAVRPFAGILVRQPQLGRRLRLGSFAALDQRIALRYGLGGMDAKESADYLAHHLKLVGREDRLFSDDVAHFATALDDHRFPVFADDFDRQAESAVCLRNLRDDGATVLPGHDPQILRPGPLPL